MQAHLTNFENRFSQNHVRFNSSAICLHRTWPLTIVFVLTLKVLRFISLILFLIFLYFYCVFLFSYIVLHMWRANARITIAVVNMNITIIFIIYNTYKNMHVTNSSYISALNAENWHKIIRTCKINYKHFLPGQKGIQFLAQLA